MIMKKLMSLLLALVMCMGLCVPAFGLESLEAQIQAEIEREEERVFADVQRQLEEQGALGLMDIYKSIFATQIEINVRAEYGLVTRVPQYTLTYGGAIGYESTLGATVLSTYYTHEQYADSLSPVFSAVAPFSVSAVLALVAAYFEKPNKHFSSIIGAWGWVYSGLLAINTVCTNVVNQSIIKNGGYAQIMNIDDGIDTGSVTMAWNNFPIAIVPSDGYNIHVESFPRK